MKALLALAALMIWSGAAFAQANAIIDPETLPEGVALDQRYRSTLKRLPEPKVTHDPWGYVRASEQKSDDKKRESRAR